MKGYAGKLLFVNLTDGSFKQKDLSEEVARNFVGGYGLGARVLYDMMKPGIDPLGPDNVLGFITGPLTATGALFSGRYVVVCKSPVTGGWNDANAGGHFGPELKKAGYDAVFISGISEKPVYLWINDGNVEIRDASGLWGKDTTKALEKLIEETGEQKLRAALIGPAGENQSLIACVINDKHRAAGRGGSGAVMGSKKLKAVAVRGTGNIEVDDFGKLRMVNQSINAAIKDGPNAPLATAFGQFGTTAAATLLAIMGDSPIKNWGGVAGVDFAEESARKLDSPITMDPKYKTKKYACASCPLGCGAEYEVNERDWPVGKTNRPEYETMAAFGCLCLNDNAEAIIKCNDLCNRYGLDTISTGSTIAWAIECYENGVITKEETHGIELTWGNARAIVGITEAIGQHKGFGKILALGSRGAAQKLGKGGEYLQTVNGIELPMHDPKWAPGYARTLQSDPTPGRHVKGGRGGLQITGAEQSKYNYENTGTEDLQLTTFSELLNATGLCMFSAHVGADMMKKAVPDFLEAATGRTFNSEDMFRTGMRIINMRHAFNLREGQKLTDLDLPSRCVGEPPLQEGPTARVTVDYQKLHRNFCQAMQWDAETLIPSKESLEFLGGLEDVASDLWK